LGHGQHVRPGFVGVDLALGSHVAGEGAGKGPAAGAGLDDGGTGHHVQLQEDVPDVLGVHDLGCPLDAEEDFLH